MLTKFWRRKPEVYVKDERPFEFGKEGRYKLKMRLPGVKMDIEMPEDTGLTLDEAIRRQDEYASAYPNCTFMATLMEE